MANTPSYSDYPVFLAALKDRVLQVRTSAARAVNREMILLYWDIGYSIVEKQQKAGWGESVVERLAVDLRAGFPSPEFLAQVVRELVATVLWGHHVVLLGKLTDPAARLYYLRATAQSSLDRAQIPLKRATSSKAPFRPSTRSKRNWGLLKTFFITAESTDHGNY